MYTMYLKGVNKALFLFSLILILFVFLFSCASDKASGNNKVETPKAEESKIRSINDLNLSDSIVSINEIDVSYKNFSAYEILFLSKGLQIQADITLPNDYVDKNYPIVFYYPEINVSIESMILQFSSNKLITAKLYERGNGKSEGLRDIGGTDHLDAINLAAILNQAECFEESKKIIIGSSIGSIIALRAASDSNLFSACAVIDTISDIPAFIESSGNGIENLFSSAVGKTINEAPDEYSNRSAISFSDKIDIPVLILAYRNHPHFPSEQSEILYRKMQINGKESQLFYIDKPASDFNEAARKKLFSWLKSLDFNPDEEALSSSSDKINYIFESSVSTEEYNAIISETSKAIDEVNKMLGIERSEGFDVVFDSKYTNKKSYTDYIEKTLYCFDYCDFIHEYIHMALYLSPSRVYEPEAIIDEGTATYFSLIWQENFGHNYNYLFKEPTYPSAESETIFNMLKNKELPLTRKNFENAFVALVTNTAGPNQYKKLSNDFINYQIGCVLTEYLITQCGGKDIYFSVFYDSIKTDTVYGKSLDSLTVDALKWNSERFK